MAGDPAAEGGDVVGLAGGETMAGGLGGLSGAATMGGEGVEGELLASDEGE